MPHTQPLPVPHGLKSGALVREGEEVAQAQAHKPQAVREVQPHSTPSPLLVEQVAVPVLQVQAVVRLVESVAREALAPLHADR